MKIKITSDSTCDLSPELLRENDIELFPLFINKGDESFRDGVDIQPADIFAHVAAGGALCSTAAVPVGVFHDRFAELAKEYDAVFHVNIGSGFSASHQNAVLAAEDLPNVYVIDSRNLSTGQGHVVLEACRLAKTATDPEEMYRQLNAFAPTVDASFLLDRLDYMKKGGRCSAVTLLGANLLKLRPCIEVKDGKMDVGKKYRGSFDKCVCEYITDKIGNRSDLELRRVFITHSGVSEETVQKAVETVQKLQPFEEICVTRAGCTVSSHCGPGTLGVLYIRKADQ